MITIVQYGFLDPGKFPSRGFILTKRSEILTFKQQKEYHFSKVIVINIQLLSQFGLMVHQP